MPELLNMTVTVDASQATETIDRFKRSMESLAKAPKEATTTLDAFKRIGDTAREVIGRFGGEADVASHKFHGFGFALKEAGSKFQEFAASLSESGVAGLLRGGLVGGGFAAGMFAIGKSFAEAAKEAIGVHRLAEETGFFAENIERLQRLGQGLDIAPAQVQQGLKRFRDTMLEAGAMTDQWLKKRAELTAAGVPTSVLGSIEKLAKSGEINRAFDLAVGYAARLAPQLREKFLEGLRLPEIFARFASEHARHLADALPKVVERNAKTAEEYSDSLWKLGLRFESLGNIVFNELSPAFTTLQNELSNLLEANEKPIGDQIARWGKASVAELKNVIGGFKEFEAWLNSNSALLRGLKTILPAEQPAAKPEAPGGDVESAMGGLVKYHKGTPADWIVNLPEQIASAITSLGTLQAKLEQTFQAGQAKGRLLPWLPSGQEERQAGLFPEKGPLADALQAFIDALNRAKDALTPFAERLNPVGKPAVEAEQQRQETESHQTWLQRLLAENARRVEAERAAGLQPPAEEAAKPPEAAKPAEPSMFDRLLQSVDQYNKDMLAKEAAGGVPPVGSNLLPTLFPPGVPQGPGTPAPAPVSGQPAAAPQTVPQAAAPAPPIVIPSTPPPDIVVQPPAPPPPIPERHSALDPREGGFTPVVQPTTETGEMPGPRRIDGPAPPPMTNAAFRPRDDDATERSMMTPIILAEWSKIGREAWGDIVAAHKPRGEPELEQGQAAWQSPSIIEPQRIEGDARIRIDVNAPRGTLVATGTTGDLFKEIQMNRSSQMAQAADWLEA